MGRSDEIVKRLSDLDIRPDNFSVSSEVMHSRQTVKPLTFERQTSWTVFKIQSDVVNFIKGWTDILKVSQLVACLRGSVAEVLQDVPGNKVTDLTTIEKALEYRFEDSHFT
ncbi:hypothetical protein AVEN_201255-1 [Araneus ventricosus]|uniref:Uncharacterized protein n=1 Tax=Araneus ventricosus TaxID=182803 RepID=A0A4Y2X5Y7_ARAVE|nr:hypothetical protein AVEN_176179-1 [Araneus ventricosus]GBO45373.1 hypothetical protein AVEN_201255-1 [Araneus ventricosus]